MQYMYMDIYIYKSARIRPLFQRLQSLMIKFDLLMFHYMIVYIRLFGKYNAGFYNI